MNSQIPSKCEGTAEASHHEVSFTSDLTTHVECIRKSIESTQHHSQRGLWAFMFFLAVSMYSWCISGVEVASPMLPGELLLIDPAHFLLITDIVLAVSTLCDLILIAGRLNDGGRPERIWFHVWFRTAFYLLYLLGGVLPIRFFAVFLAGLLVIGFEQVALYLYASRVIREEKQLLGALSR